MTHTLVVGATGYLGRYLVAELHDRGHSVRAVARDQRLAEKPGSWGAPPLSGLVDEWVIGDIRDAGLVANLAVGTDSVVSALGVTRQKADPWEIDYRANLSILESAERQRVGAFCYVNALGADRCPAQLTQAKTAFARKLHESPVPSQIISPPAYFSDMMQILRMARRGRVYLLRPRAQINPIHGADLAAACIDRLEAGEAGAWDVGGPDVLTWQQITEQAFAALGRPRRTTTVPAGVAEALAGLMALWSPRQADIFRFVIWGMRNDCVGETVGAHRLSDLFAQQAAGDRDGTGER